MATILQLRRGTTTQHSSFTGAVGEVTVDTTKDTVVVHDGTTAGGFPLAKESALSSFIDLTDISVTDAGGEGSLSYNNTTGVLTYTGPSASDILTAIKTVDGSGSGLDADLLDGNSSAYFRINVYDAAGNLLN
jgi:hypothetical protein